MKVSVSQSAIPSREMCILASEMLSMIVRGFSEGKQD